MRSKCGYQNCPYLIIQIIIWLKIMNNRPNHLYLIMKDFQQFLETPEAHANAPNVQPLPPPTPLQQLQTTVLPYLTPFILSIITAPLTTASILLQTTKHKAAPETALKLKTQPQLTRHITNGIFGDNRIYQANGVGGYKQVLSRLGREGVRGFYKGNLTGILLSWSNTGLRGMLYNMGGQKGWADSQKALLSNFLTITTCTLADFITLPLMTAQSRLVLQNSSPHFRTYSNFFSVIRQTHPTLLFSGASLLLAKNIIFDIAWLKIIPSSPAYSFILSNILSHLLIYPFTTVMRQLQVSCGEPMMYGRQKVGEVVRRLMRGGIRDWYGGFGAYVLVHSFVGIMLVESNLRSGFFDEQ